MPKQTLPKETLFVVTTVSNPIRWDSRTNRARAAIEAWTAEPNVHVTVVEILYGDRGPELDDLASDRVLHISAHASTTAWSKECALNVGLTRLSPMARYIGFFDADILWRKPGWATEILHALQLYPVVQPWSHCYDLGPNGEHLATHTSFARIYCNGGNVVPRFDPNSLSLTNSPYPYPHPGYAWCWRRNILDRVGGLFELGGCGSGDHHMALALIGKAKASVPTGVNEDFREILEVWQSRALRQVNRKIGYVPGTIEHPFHGRKRDRGYNSRWWLFLKHGFDPLEDLKKNTYGIIEWAGNKPELEREWMLYLRGREEDANVTT